MLSPPPPCSRSHKGFGLLLGKRRAFCLASRGTASPHTGLRRLKGFPTHHTTSAPEPGVTGSMPSQPIWAYWEAASFGASRVPRPVAEEGHEEMEKGHPDTYLPTHLKTQPSINRAAWGETDSHSGNSAHSFPHSPDSQSAGQALCPQARGPCSARVGCRDLN